MEQTQIADQKPLFRSRILFHMWRMIYGYTSVSTEAQHLTGSTPQLKAAGCLKIYRENIFGKTADRPQRKTLVAVLAHGDVVVVPAVDRLSRDSTDLLNIAGDVQQAGTGIRSLAEPFVDATSYFAEIVLLSLALPRSFRIAASRNAWLQAAPMRKRRA